MGPTVGAALFWGLDVKGRDHFGDLGVDRRVILKRILEKYGTTMRTGISWLRIRSSSGLV
jgi:hypothetical protein